MIEKYMYRKICTYVCYIVILFYLDYPNGTILVKKIREVCHWKGLVTQAKLYANPCKICQRSKKRKTIYGHIPSKNIAELKSVQVLCTD